MTRFQLMRMIWIDAWLENSELPLQRQHLCLTFDLSMHQASLDLRRFAERWPGRLAYDNRRRGYLAATGSNQVFEAYHHSAVVFACVATTEAKNSLVQP